jgi:hypothetical protein
MTQAENYFKQLASEIPGVKEGKVFGTECITIPNGKSAAMLWKDNIVVKLKGEHLKEAMSLDGTKQFEPMEGRPMKEWIQIPFEHKDKWKKFALISVESVKHLKVKELHNTN